MRLWKKILAAYVASASLSGPFVISGFYWSNRRGRGAPERLATRYTRRKGDTARVALFWCPALSRPRLLISGLSALPVHFIPGIIHSFPQLYAIGGAFPAW